MTRKATFLHLPGPLASDFDRIQEALPKRYTVQRELDRGGMSRVYLAREHHPNRDVVIKVLDEELTARVGRERFVRGVEVTSQLAHPHIVPIYAAGDAGGTLYDSALFDPVRDTSGFQDAVDEVRRRAEKRILSTRRSLKDVSGS